MTDPIRVTVHLLAMTAADPDTTVARRHSDEAPTSFTLDLPEDFPRVGTVGVADLIYQATNRQDGRLWHLLSGHYPSDASHTSLCPGDLIVVDGVYVQIDPFGFSVLRPTR